MDAKRIYLSSLFNWQLKHFRYSIWYCLSTKIHENWERPYFYLFKFQNQITPKNTKHWRASTKQRWYICFYW